MRRSAEDKIKTALMKEITMRKTNINLIPDSQNVTPDYYCTWQTQLYATNDGKPKGQRAIIGEKALFSKEKPFGWAYFYEQVRKDLYIVMDDSWDVPPNGDLSYCGSLILNGDKFPSFVKDSSDNTEAMKKLSDKIKDLGWKGLGCWVCSKESPRFKGDISREEYWIERLVQANKAGIAYWKVDWGDWGADAAFRKKLTELGRQYAPDLIIENAIVPEVIPFSDTFRTYDVPAIMSIPMTMEKIKSFTSVPEPKNGNMCLLNCEDEAYISAAGGFAMGIMRHPYNGAFVNGKADMSFPQIHRNLKTKIYEIIRAVRFHKLAPAYAFSGNELKISKDYLCDSWRFENAEEEIEAWWFDNPAVFENLDDNVLKVKAPAVISRNTELPSVCRDDKGEAPFVVASRNPNGVYAVATLGRTVNRSYYIPKCDVTIDAEDSKTIGVFGEYKNLIIKTKFTAIKYILIQDLADDSAYDVTDSVEIKDGEIIVCGDIISKTGTFSQPEEDTSEPGVVIYLGAE